VNDLSAVRHHNERDGMSRNRDDGRPVGPMQRPLDNTVLAREAVVAGLMFAVVIGIIRALSRIARSALTWSVRRSRGYSSDCSCGQSLSGVVGNGPGARRGYASLGHSPDPS
jgi:hypothetical protein